MAEDHDPDVVWIGSTGGRAGVSSSAAELIPPPPRLPSSPSTAARLREVEELLAASEAAKRRLEADLAAAKEKAEAAEERHLAQIDQERQTYRREVEFVKQGVDAAAAQRELQMQKRKESHERALKRAVDKAEERERAAASAAAAELQAAHEQAMREQAERYETHLEGLRAQWAGLASDARSLCREGRWPGGAAASDAVEQAAAGAPDAEEHLDAEGAYRILCAALAAAGARNRARPPGS